MARSDQQYFLHAFNLFTIILWGMNVLEVFTRGQVAVTGTAACIYLLLLTYYVTDKEIRRWHRKYKTNHRPGELIVAGWLVLLFVTLAVEMSSGAGHGYIVPRQLPLIAGTVTVLLLLTEYFKQAFKPRRRFAWLRR